MDYPVIIVEYDPQWPQQFEAEKEQILAALRGFDVTIEHVGSTSVPGLAAKPIIDIMAVVPNSTTGEQCIAPLTALDYEYRGEMDIPGRFYFTKGVPRTFHLHLFPLGHPEIERHLLFRNYLRAHPDTAREYADLKRALATQYRHERALYTEAKTDFIRAVEARAHAEQRLPV